MKVEEEDRRESERVMSGKKARIESGTIAGFEDGERGPREDRRGKEMILPWSLQKGPQSCQHLDFSPVRPLSDF